MYYSSHLRVLLVAAMLLPGSATLLAQSAQPAANSQTASTEVHLHWGARPGVSRYRLQLANDSLFADIVFDHVVRGIDYQVNDLPPGKYFWRVAPLTSKLGDFSSTGVIQVAQPTLPSRTLSAQSTPPITNSSRPNVVSNPIVVRGGWRAAVGDIAHPVLAHLRSSEKLDLVGVNSEGIVFALDSGSGVALWTSRKMAAVSSARGLAGSASLILAPSRSGIDNVVVLSGTIAAAIEGATGRELWRVNLPANTSSGIVVGDNRSAEIFLIDNSLQRAMILDSNDGKLLAQIKLPHRVVGTPVTFLRGDGRVGLAYESGNIEIRDMAGAVVRSGDLGSPATTAPLFISSRRGDLILVGTRNGLTALTADLSALGMVAIKGDAPRGVLAAADLFGDGSSEVIMITNRGRVVAVGSADGKTLWETSVSNESEAVAFVDVDGDQVLDVLMAAGPGFALALSGRDGSLVWKDSEPAALVANHSVSLSPRSIVAMPYGAGTLLIAGDPSRTSLRAVEFPKGTTRPKR
jgi:outer membrane protein assembly factor BamB